MRKRVLCLLSILLILIVTVLFYLCGETLFLALQEPEWIENMTDGQQVKVYGEVWKKAGNKESYILYLKDCRILDWQVAEGRLPVYLISDAREPLPKIGQKVLVAGNVGTFQEAPNPGNFNQKFYYQKQNIHVGIRNARILDEKGDSTKIIPAIKEKIWEVRQVCSEWTIDCLGEEQGGILCAMVLGEGTLTDGEVKELYQKSGIGHLLAISGLHISFFGLGMFKILRKAGIPLKCAALTGGLFLTAYVMMSGASVSSLRAYIMFLIRMGAIMTGREYDGLSALAAASIIVVARNPLQIFDTGFLLSFGAVLGIYLLSPVFERLIKKGKTFGAFAAIQIFVLPVMLYYYFEISPFSFVWNLLAVPLAGWVLGGGIFGLVLKGAALAVGESVIAYPFEVISKICFGVSGMILRFYKWGSEAMLGFPNARWVIGKPEIWQIAGYYLLLWMAVLCMERWMKQGKKGRAAVLGGFSLVCAIVLLMFPKWKWGQTEVVMLNVGQGDCFFVRGPLGGTYLIDGGSSTVSSVGRYRIEAFLKSQGVGTLDYVWVTHGDTDHVNGIEELLKRQQFGVKIGHLVMPPETYWDKQLEQLAVTAHREEIPVLTMGQGQRFEEGEMEVVCLWPERENDDSMEGNEASVVLSLTFGAFDMLFTGDVEKEGEEELAAYMLELQAKGKLPDRYEVLKAGHHGSRYATGENLIEVVRPACAWISAGEDNQYGHPHQEVLERLANWGASLYNTKDGSAVKLCTDGEKYYILIP